MKNISNILIYVFLITIFSVAGCKESNRPENPPSQNTIPQRKNSDKSAIDNFVNASAIAIPAVVHIKTKYPAPAAYVNPYGQIYRNRGAAVVMGSGSGVVISSDGYIATNNHVVENASEIEVVFPDRRAFSAKLIGTDPSTDLALIKVEASGLSGIKPGNSDQVEVGEWVLAVGYPLSLNSTVTAGIISAKGRSIGIINRSAEGQSRNPESHTGNTAIESFLQTDAAINPGNSGGALVNTNGELIGINTAIASQTGSYAGYAFAIPVNLAIKILDDLKKYGSVKRGILGVSFPAPAVEERYLKQQGIDPGSVQGVYIFDVQQGSAAAEGGLKEGDIIEKIDGVPVISSAEFSERIARHRPGDKIQLTYSRNGKTNTTTVTLKEEQAAPRPNETIDEIYKKLGASFAPVPDELKQRLNISSGVVTTEIYEGGFFERLGIPAGTIIVIINGKPVNSPADIERAFLSARRGIIQIFAIAPDGSRVVFNFSLGT